MFDGQPKEVLIYRAADGTRPFAEWRDNLNDRAALARIQTRLDRLEEGNPGDYKSIGSGLYELRIKFGAGYRVYFAFNGLQIVLLLCGGTKKTQQADIEAARTYWKDHQERETA